MKTRRQFLQTALESAAVAVAFPAVLEAATDSQSPAPPGVSGATAPNAAGPFGNVTGPIVQDGVAPPHTIDWHNHWISPRAVDLLKKHDASHPALDNQAGDPYSLGPSSNGLPHPTAPGPNSNFLIGVEERFDHLNKVGVERQVISWPTTLGWDAVLDPEEAKPIWTVFNDDLSAFVKQYPDRISGYSVVPTSDISWAATETERGFHDLGLIGVVVPVGAFQTLEGARHLTPVLDVIQAHKGILYLHTGPAYHTIPGQRTSDESPDRSLLASGRLVAPATFARAAVTLTQTDYLKPYPDVTVQIAMMGGLTSFLFSLTTLNPALDDGPDPITRLRRVYIDASTSRIPGTLKLAVQTIGPDRILFGTDYGAGRRIDPVVAAVNHAGLTDDEKQQVFVETGQKLFAEKGRANA
jgi:predicted TIM-barrel fold metal-dependent hydrolase